MIDRTLQNKMEVEKAEMERTWSANGRRVVALQNRMVKLGEEIKNEKVIMKTNFKSFQQKQKDFFKEKQKNDMLNFKEKAKERKLAKAKKKGKKK